MKNRILRSALSVALCAAMLLSQGLTAFAENEIVPSPNNEGNSAAAEFSLLEEKAGEPSVTDGENVPETPASTEDETKTETTTGQPTAEDDTAKETTAKTPAVVNEEEKSEEATAAPAEAQAATNSLKGWGDCDRPSNQPTKGCHPDPIPLSNEPNVIDVIAALPGFSFDCKNSNCNDSESIDLKDLAFTIGEVNSAADTVNITFDNTAFSTSLAKFNEKYGKHNLAEEEPIVVTLTWDAEKDSWYYAGNVQNIIVPVECDKGCHPDPIPLPNKSDVIAALPGFSFDCENSNCNASESIELNDLVFTIGEVNRKAGTVDITFDNAAFSTSLAKFNEKCGKHNLAKEQPIVVTLTWNAKKDYWYYAGNEQNIIVPVECDKGCHPDPIPLPNKSDVIAALPGFSFDCENSNCNASESIELNDLVFTIGEVNRKAGTVDITFDNAAFSTSLAKFNEKCGKHNLAKEQPIVVTLTWNAKKDYWYYAGNEQNIIVPVECSFPSNNVPAVPTYKDLEELLGNMTVYCVNENHLVSKAYPITWNTIGGLNQKPVQNDDGTFSMEITVSYDPFKDLFEDDFGAHDYVESIELARSVVSLKWSEIEGVGAWRVDGSFINSFNVICDTPSTESLWGWNNGKEVIITCVEENALHTKGMTLSLVGVNGDKYWKFDPITWDQEQKCYTTTVTLEPDKYL